MLNADCLSELLRLNFFILVNYLFKSDIGVMQHKNQAAELNMLNWQLGNNALSKCLNIPTQNNNCKFNVYKMKC